MNPKFLVIAVDAPTLDASNSVVTFDIRFADGTVAHQIWSWPAFRQLQTLCSGIYLTLPGEPLNLPKGL